MKLKKINLNKISYPHILNPIYLIVMVIYTIYVLLFGWVSKKSIGNNIILYYDNYKYRLRIGNMLMGWIGLLNTYYMNRRLVEAYAKYKVYPINHFHEKNSVQYNNYYMILKKRYYYLKTK